jgi:hypothetical protein
MNFTANFEKLQISQNTITVLASGDSVNKMSPEQFEYLKKTTYIITMNYSPCKFIGHANIWSDIKVTDFLRQHYMNKEKDHLFISRQEAFRAGTNEWADFHKKIDYFFSTASMKGHYTLGWIFQLLYQYFPQKQVIVFGLDLKEIDNANDIKKWYDRIIKNDQIGRGKNFPLQKKLDAFQQEVIQMKTTIPGFDQWCDRVLNCNMESNAILFRKVDWESIVGKDWQKGIP